MLVFWAVTPLQSAIFGTQAVIVTEQVATYDIARLGTLQQQLDALDESILHTAYGITWLKQPFPAFTTTAHALIPFRPLKDEAAVLPDETWTTSATALSTDLKCWPAIVSATPDVKSSFEFDNGQGCKATLEPSTHGRLGNETSVIHTVLYIGYYMDPQLDWYLENPDCRTAASHQFLAIWMAQDTKDMTALFCEPSYWKQSVMITVAAENKRPDESSIVPLGDRVLLEENDFNSTAFEYLIGTGASPKVMRRDYPKDRLLEQYPTLVKFNLAWPITNMVGFALGGMNSSIGDLKDANTLQSVFSVAHKRLFSAAIPSLLQTADVSSLTRPSTVQYTLYGVTMSRPLALAVEVLLLVITFLVSAILYFSSRTQSILLKDPGSMGATLEILGESDTLLTDFACKDYYEDATLRQSIQGNRYKLVQTAAADGERLHIEHYRPSNHNTGVDPDLSTLPGKAIQPTALKPLSGLTFVVTLLAGIVVLLYLKNQEVTLGGKYFVA